MNAALYLPAWENAKQVGSTGSSSWHKGTWQEGGLHYAYATHMRATQCSLEAQQEGARNAI